MGTRKWTSSLVLLLAACSNGEGPTGENFRDVPADMIVIGMTEYMTAAGLRKARLQGDTAYVHDDSGKVKVKGVNLLIFDEQGGETAKLTSKTGDFNTSTQAMVARGTVVLITTKGKSRRIETEELFYDPQSKRIWSNVNTVMIEDGQRASGDGFTADDQFQNVQIKNLRGRAPVKIQF
jgi:LPS export ABC transporter protein LptC